MDWMEVLAPLCPLCFGTFLEDIPHVLTPESLGIWKCATMDMHRTMVAESPWRYNISAFG
jgi:hypothetical protein